MPGQRRKQMNDALDGACLSFDHWKLWVLSAFGVALDGFDFFIIGVALPLIKKEFNATSWQVGAVGAAAVLGAVIGAAVFGPLTDRIGRKGMYLLDLLFFVVFAGLSALAWDIWSLLAFRFLLGIGIGADYPISACYVSETMPARLRGRMTSSTVGFQALGMLFGAVAGLVLLLVVKDLSAWRWMLAVGVVPALLVIFLRTTVPESPRWLAAHGKQAEAASALAALTGQPVAEPGLEPAPAAGPPAAPGPSPVRQLFGPSLWRSTLLACVPWFLMDIATYGVGLFTPTILMSLAFRPERLAHGDPFLAREILSVEGAVFLDFFLIIGFALAILLIDRVGRIPLQIFGFLGMAVGLGILAVAGFGEQQNLFFVFTGFILFNTLMNAGPNTTTYVLPSEIFPTQLRATAHGLASASGKVGATVGIFFLPIFQNELGLEPTLLLVAAAAVLGAAVTWLTAVETVGRSLEEFEMPAADVQVAPQVV
jgi:MFS family permease